METRGEEGGRGALGESGGGVTDSYVSVSPLLRFRTRSRRVMASCRPVGEVMEGLGTSGARVREESCALGGCIWEVRRLGEPRKTLQVWGAMRG